MDNKFAKHYTISPEKINKNPARVGQAAFDILSKKAEQQTVEETIDAMTPQYMKELQTAASLGSKEYQSPFYVVVLRKKETVGGSLSNVLHHKYVRRQTRPKASFLRSEFPNSDHDVYEVNSSTSSITLLWTLPTKQDCGTILKNKQLYDPQLVKWIEDFQESRLYEEPQA